MPSMDIQPLLEELLLARGPGGQEDEFGKYASGSWASTAMRYLSTRQAMSGA